MSQRKVAITQGTWGIVNVAAIRLITFVAQIVLAIMLSPRDFGVYAVAMAVSTMALTFRGAGVTHWQIEGGERHHEKRSVDAFWLALCWNLALGVTVTAAARPLGALFDESGVGILIAFIGLSFPLQTPATYYFARLQIQLRIKELTLIELASAVLRSGVMIGGAAMGLGAYSFVLPIPLCYLLEAAMGYWMVRESPWRRAPNWRQWPGILRNTSWIMAGTAGTAVGLQGDYVVLGALAPIGAVGIYYFAYQLTLQTAGLVSTNINRVFTSVLVSSRSTAKGRNFVEATQFIMLAGSPIVLLLAAGIAPLEHLIWAGKWEAAVPAVIYLSLGLPLYLLATAVQSLVLSDGRFRRWMLLNASKGVFVVGAALFVGTLGGDDGDVIAAGMSVGLAVAHLVQVGVGVRRIGIRPRELWNASWIGALVAPAALLMTQIAMRHLAWPTLAELFVGPTLMLIVYGLALALLRPTLTARTASKVRHYIARGPQG